MLKHQYEQTMKGVRLWTGEMEVEQEALQQIRNISTLPILAGHIAIMPDVHFGMGAERELNVQGSPATLSAR